MRDQHFGSLTDIQLENIDQYRTELIYKKGENLCKQGAFVSNLMYVQSGLVKLYVERNGLSSILFLKNGGNFIGIPSLYGDTVHHYSVEAIAETKVCLINFDKFKELLSENSAFATDVIQIVNEDMVNAFNRIASFSSKQLHGRLAELLIFLREEIYESNPFKITMSKTDLADLLSTSKESVSRLFTQLKKDNIITESQHVIHILDEDKLRRISQTG